MTARSAQLDAFARPRRMMRYHYAGDVGVAMLVDRAVVGDRATIFGARQSFLAPRCDSPATVNLGCLSCRQPLFDLANLLFHLELHPDQTHVIARQCADHGWEAL